MPDYEDVQFPARGEPGVTIRAWWIPAAAATAPAIVVVHGEGSCRRDPTILVPAGMLDRDGFDVLMIDMRNNGDSTRTDGHYGFGSVEYRDVEGAWDWLVSRGLPPGKIGLYGQSGGGPVVIVAMGEDPRIAAGWEESSPADIWTVAGAEARRMACRSLRFPLASSGSWPSATT
jgi:dipeptidyl aminopeptidase/acylaminoacyl peptidase